MALGAPGKSEPSKTHKFWSTQPVPQSETELAAVTNDGPVKASLSTAEIEALTPLPADFKWVELDIDAESDMDDLYELLKLNYVEDNDALFRFDYQPSFLRWVLKPPGWNASWHVGVRVASSNKLVAFISAIPISLKVRENVIKCAEVNFLCVHKTLRSKRLAPVMIKEITRRCVKLDIHQAIYTSGTRLPEPFSTATYFHRPLNYTKLVEAHFCAHPLDRTVSAMEQQYRLPKNAPANLVPLTSADVDEALDFLNRHLADSALHQVFSRAEVEHWLLPREDILCSYARKNPSSGKIDALFSFYCIPSTIMSECQHKTLKVGYLFYTFVDDQDCIEAVTKSGLVKARDLGFDVMNALDVMGNDKFLPDLLFTKGDGQLHYYLYNWKTAPITKELNGFLIF